MDFVNGSRVLVVAALNPVFNGATGTIISDENELFNRIKLDEDMLTDERMNAMKASVMLFGKPVFIAMDFEICLLDDIPEDEVIQVGDSVIVVKSFDPSAVGMVGKIRQVAVDDSDCFLVEFNIDEVKTDILLGVMTLVKLDYGFFGLPLARDEIRIW